MLVSLSFLFYVSFSPLLPRRARLDHRAVLVRERLLKWPAANIVFFPFSFPFFFGDGFSFFFSSLDLPVF